MTKSPNMPYGIRCPLFPREAPSKNLLALPPGLPADVSADLSQPQAQPSCVHVAGVTQVLDTRRWDLDFPWIADQPRTHNPPVRGAL